LYLSGKIKSLKFSFTLTIVQNKKHLKNLFYALLLILSSCSSSEKFTLKKEGSDIILNGPVEKSYLNNPKLFPWFYYGYKAYQPKDSILNLLKPEVSKLGFLIFAGSWCGDTQKEIPAFYKVADLIGVKDNQIQLIMVDRNKQTHFIKTSVLGIKPVPCIIIYKDSVEIGRFIESSKLSMEEDLYQIINQH
jgi:thiol-disulfide isomerase/thioredoxin